MRYKRPREPAEIRFHRYVEKTEGCWIWKRGKTKMGYGVLNLGATHGNRVVYAHRFSYRLFHGADPGELHVCHSCDNPACVNPDHLFLGTPAVNSWDKVIKGRWGGPTIYSKEFLDQVADLRREGLLYTEIAERLGLRKTQVVGIISRHFPELVSRLRGRPYPSRHYKSKSI